MAIVYGPMLAIRASGQFGKTVIFHCGKWVRQKPKTEDVNTEKQQKQRTKFLDALDVWRGLADTEKRRWSYFAAWVVKRGICPYVEYAMTGFNAFMSFYLSFGPSGWAGYPLAPDVPDYFMQTRDYDLL